MEESGHYYTVYFTSLAVGFDESTAYRHAVLAQMPDEVGYLDAANVHFAQCIGSTEFNLAGKEVAPPADWRFLIEYAIHSLPDKKKGNLSAEYQRRMTGEQLLGNKPDSLAFGLLLHRLGDTYAHSVMGNEKKMYSTTISGDTSSCFNFDNLGHARHGHAPDHPYERPWLYYQYIEDLHRILYTKVQEEGSRLYRRTGAAMTAPQMVKIFQRLLQDPAGPLQLYRRKGYDRWAPNIFIGRIRTECYNYFGITMRRYSPEWIGEQTLQSFLNDHPELKQMGIDEISITHALREIEQQL